MNSHWPLFRKFIRAEKAVGGPDCQFTLLIEHAQLHTPSMERDEWMWLVGCYGAHHCAMPAYEVYREFPYIDVLRKPKLLRTFLKEHWKALPVRREMRSHRMLEKRWTCLIDFARYTNSGRWKRGMFDDLWIDTQEQIKYYGRYMAIKTLELMRRTGVRPDVHSYDIRAAHAWSPRAAMALLYPQHAEWLGDRTLNDPTTVRSVEKKARRIHDDLVENQINVSFFELQGLLCNYKEMLYGRFYPGAGHDEELDYLREFGKDFDVRPWFATRKRIFNRKYLGEIGGWEGIRKEEGERWMQMRVDAKLHLPPRGHGA